MFVLIKIRERERKRRKREKGENEVNDMCNSNSKCSQTWIWGRGVLELVVPHIEVLSQEALRSEGHTPALLVFTLFPALSVFCRFISG